MSLKVKTGELNSKNAVFIGFHLKSKIYENYEAVPKKMQNSYFGQVLLLSRWDGKFGFVGGFVDKGENLMDALKRETLEEINFEIKGGVKSVCSHQISDDMNVHFYSLEITDEEKSFILENSMEAKDFKSEVSGVVFHQIFSHPEKGIEPFLENAYFAPAVREELEILIEKEKLNLHK